MKVLDRYAGQTGPCAICAKTISIPGTPSGQPHLGQQRIAHRTGQDQASGLSLGTILAILGGSVVCFCVMLIATAVTVQVVYPSAQKMRLTKIHSATLGDMEVILDALNLYHDQHGTFPPAYLPDENGKPMHSWRVLILPQLNRKDLHDQYRFDQPWNSPENIDLMSRIPEVYQNDVDSSTMTTRIMAVIGEKTIFPRGKSTSRSQILDDPNSVLAIVEINGPGLEWTNPSHDYYLKNPSATNIIVGDPNDPLAVAGSTLSGNVGMINGDAHHLSDTTTPQLLLDFSTRSGGESLGIELQTATDPNL